MRIRRWVSILWTASIVTLFVVYIINTFIVAHNRLKTEYEPRTPSTKYVKHQQPEVKNKESLVKKNGMTIHNNTAKPATWNSLKEGFLNIIKVHINDTSCPLQKKELPQIDIQMLSIYKDMDFKNIEDAAIRIKEMYLNYNELQWTDDNKLKVFIVLHSHNDPGWLKTYDTYYVGQTRRILKNILKLLPLQKRRKFIWTETSFLNLWWENDATIEDINIFRNLLKNGQIEIVTGGWVMNDEANTHWLSIMQQLTTGHQWLLDKLDYIPKNAWAIDSFGHSSSQAYLLKLAGFKNSVIQRVHYRIKLEMALNRNLEFYWRQLWDGMGATDMFTHVMPFSSYNIKDSCGPNPEVCCQFDFRTSSSCSSSMQPVNVTRNNIDERALLILNEWRKKSQLFRTNVVMAPLGDDFSYSRESELVNQLRNYELLMDYINANKVFNTEVKFGTLQDYFGGVHSELRKGDFSTLSGDFFTYADIQDQYWSGYYTSRPFYKNMERVLLAYLRTAEITLAQVIMANLVPYSAVRQIRDDVEIARQSLALFQHHDAITGTSTDEVMVDFASRLETGIKQCQSAIQQTVLYLLGQSHVIKRKQEDVLLEVDDVWRYYNEMPSRKTIHLNASAPFKRILLYNSVSFRRQEVVTVIASTPYVGVYDQKNNPVLCQVSPVVNPDKRLGIATDEYGVSFLAAVDPLALSVYVVTLKNELTADKYTTFSKISIYNASHITRDLPKIFQVHQYHHRLDEDLTLESSTRLNIIFSKDGLIRSIISPSFEVHPMQMEFIRYSSLRDKYMHSGAYVFLPNEQPEVLQLDELTVVVTVEGPVKTTLYSALYSPDTVEITLAISIYNNPSLPHTEVEIVNILMLEPIVTDIELALRFTTKIQNDDFYTDLNGMQMIKRAHIAQLPTQANFYPLPSATYIQDSTHRLTLLTSTPLGMAAQRKGQIEIMQDRRLKDSDSKGLAQGVMDNVLTRHVFRIILENKNKECNKRVHPQHPSGQLSIGAHVSQQTLLHPLVVMHYSPIGDLPKPVYNPVRTNLGVDIVLASFRSHISGKNRLGRKIGNGFGMTFQRLYLDECYGSKGITKWYPMGNGTVKPSDISNLRNESKLYESSLTFVQIIKQLPREIFTLCPMEIRSILIDY